MKISVAMCTYNGERYLREQLQSIREQTRPPDELVVCDDRSSDGTTEIVEQFAESVPFPVRLYRNAENLGSTKNFEQAIKLCQGDAIALCDQDDRWLPQRLAVAEAALKARPQVAGVFSNAALVDEEGRLLEGDLWQRSEFTSRKVQSFDRSKAVNRLIERDTVTGATFVFRSSYVPILFPIPQDWVHDGWIALILASVAELEALPERLICYRLHAEQQVGAREVPWHAHLSTQKDLAIASHEHGARRFFQMAEKLTELGADRRIAEYARSKAIFLEGRATDLRRSRMQRIPSVLWRLPGYLRFDKGPLSLMRDLAH